MDNGYIGEIRLVAFDFVPQGWLPCNGQMLKMELDSPYLALWLIIRTTYGGNDNDRTFQIPNLNRPLSRYPIGVGAGHGLNSYSLGATGGATSVTLSSNSMPRHTHTGVFNPTGGVAPTVNASFLVEDAVPTTNVPDGCSLTTTAGGNSVFTDAPGTDSAAIDGISGTIRSGTISNANVRGITAVGGGVPINYRAPYQTLLYVIAYQGANPPLPAAEPE